MSRNGWEDGMSETAERTGAAGTATQAAQPDYRSLLKDAFLELKRL